MSVKEAGGDAGSARGHRDPDCRAAAEQLRQPRQVRLFSSCSLTHASRLRRQTRRRRRRRQDLGAAKAAIDELFGKIGEIRRKAEASEVMVQEICRDIRKLDYAKTHLTHTITALRRLAMLVNAVGARPARCKAAAARLSVACPGARARAKLHQRRATPAYRHRRAPRRPAGPCAAWASPRRARADQLQRAVERGEYAEAARLLEAVQQLAAHFAAFGAVPKVGAWPARSGPQGALAAPLLARAAQLAQARVTGAARPLPPGARALGTPARPLRRARGAGRGAGRARGGAADESAAGGDARI